MSHSIQHPGHASTSRRISRIGAEFQIWLKESRRTFPAGRFASTLHATTSPCGSSRQCANRAMQGGAGVNLPKSNLLRPPSFR